MDGSDPARDGESLRQPSTLLALLSLLLPLPTSDPCKKVQFRDWRSYTTNNGVMDGSDPASDSESLRQPPPSILLGLLSLLLPLPTSDPCKKVQFRDWRSYTKNNGVMDGSDPASDSESLRQTPPSLRQPPPSTRPVLLL
jgi:hypothetical protein